MKKALILLPVIATLIFGGTVFAADQTNNDAKEHYRIGEIYYEHGLYREAQNEFQKALNKTPTPLAAAQINNAPAISQTSENDDLPPPKGEYLVGAGDTLMITVWENPDLTQETIVRPDGKISFPLVNEITAENRSLPQIRTEITERLAEYVKNPNVTVALRQVAGNKVMVLGEVRNPGMYKLEARKTVLEAIALAGGFTRDAVENSVIVVKGSLSDPKPQRLNLSKAMTGKTSDSAIVANQTIVYVPRKFIANVNYYVMEIIEPISSSASTGGTIKAY